MYPDLSTPAFDAIRGLVAEHAGIALSEAKRALVVSRLGKRLGANGLDSFDDYCRLLRSPAGAKELPIFINCLTTNKTDFFREKHHFDYLVKHVLPMVRARTPRARHLRIWSSASSTGEEPYTIAITLLAHLPDIATWDIRILATDINDQVLRVARTGIYAAERLQGLPADILRTYFQPAGEPNKFQLVDAVRRMVTFEQLNLNGTWPAQPERNDVVFCRNVIIYFDSDTQRRLFARIAERMHTGGTLFLGHSESLNGISTDFAAVAPTVYVLKTHQPGDGAVLSHPAATGTGRSPTATTPPGKTFPLHESVGIVFLRSGVACMVVVIPLGTATWSATLAQAVQVLAQSPASTLQAKLVFSRAGQLSRPTEAQLRDSLSNQGVTVIATRNEQVPVELMLRPGDPQCYLRPLALPVREPHVRGERRS